MDKSEFEKQKEWYNSKEGREYLERQAMKVGAAVRSALTLVVFVALGTASFLLGYMIVRMLPSP